MKETFIDSLKALKSQKRIGIRESAMNLDKRTKTLEKRISEFLGRTQFEGFTKNDLFIKRLIGKPWGQDIATLSNMAEGYLNISAKQDPRDQSLKHLHRIVELACHPRVNPYKKNLLNVRSYGYQGYYLEHLNIVLGCYRLAGGIEHSDLHQSVSAHLSKISLEESNAHARLMPHVKMRWAADQAAIINSLWLYDQASGESLHSEVSARWQEYMFNHCRHASGLFQTEVMNCKRYSKQPRGCSLVYLIHYCSSFAPVLAKEQWILFKEHMHSRVLGLWGFREYLKGYKAGMTPDSGPIIFGQGVAASGLALKTAASIEDEAVFQKLYNSSRPVLALAESVRRVPGINMVSAVATDLLSTSIQFAAITRESRSLREVDSF